MADSSKTEQATPRHRLKAREQGQITRSRELTGALAMFAVAGVMVLVARQGMAQWTDFFRSVLASATTDPIEPNGPLLFWTSVQAVRWVYPFQLAALVVALGVGLAQGGFIFAPEALTPKFERLSPASRLSQMFSLNSVSSILKSLLPFVAIAWMGYVCIESHWMEIVASSYVDARVFARLVGGLIYEICWKSGLILLLWSGVDYFLLWKKSEGDLKMSKQEIREEMKESEGNPANKARIRRLQRQNRRRQMIKAAETATVVITNPTHYAVALKYELDMAAPLVVAKGLDLLALKIREIAQDRGIPVMENRPLAQALYKGTEVGDAIPAALYHAVAEILVVVYKAQEEVKRRDAQRRSQANSAGEVNRW
ncbi:MAG: EscU/YscU/HrcU family type III secretion system export apparatus switch protein [Acidobacteriaceae bacterium]